MNNTQKALELLNQAIELLKKDNVNLVAPKKEAEQQKPVIPESKPVISPSQETPVLNACFDSSIKINFSDFPNETHPILKLLIGDWPEASPQYLICSQDEEDKFERAQGILDYIGDNLANKKVLDFGTGEGHVAIKASETASKVVGYDLNSTGQLIWEQDEKCLLTTDFSKVLTNAPYDLIILYDVIDHAKNPDALLEQLKTLCSSSTKIFVRCHSWMSRHGGHLYKQINKAWVHVFFTEEELKKMGVKTEFVQKYYYPIDHQEGLFKKAGFGVTYANFVRCGVEPFFRKPELASRIPSEYGNNFPEWQMSQLYNDYVLKLQ